MNKQTIWVILLFGSPLAWIVIDYFDHLRAFEQQDTAKVEVISINCGSSRANKVQVRNRKGEEGTFEVTDKVCSTLNVGLQIIVLESKSNGKFYWNEEPLKRVFFLFIPFFSMILYMEYWYRRKKAP